MSHTPTLFVAALGLGVSGCAHGAQLDRQLQALAALTQAAREQGAYHCAPEELARAEAELEFAREELALGDRARAEEHLVRADANARAAKTLSGDPACSAAPTSAPEARTPRPAEPISMTRFAPRLGSTDEHAAI
jgi:OOP family OmpA-OmpF porin